MKSTRPLQLAAIALTSAVIGNSAQAAFHVWEILELYTNLDGSVQFIEFFSTSGSQQFVGGQQIQVVQQGTGSTHTFTVPTNLPGDSANKRFLIATANITLFGGPTPDYVIPAGTLAAGTAFLYANGGSINFFGANSGPYTALPTDGVMSRTFIGGGNAVNSPTNFAGQTGTLIPEPATAGFIAFGALALSGMAFSRRRRA
jgi:serralysin